MMPSATEHQSSKFVKLLFVGNSGAGKTGALTSLVQAGYELRIVDMDKGLDALINHVKGADPALLEKISYVTFRDKMKMTTTGPRIDGSPKAYVNAMKALESWPDDDSDPAEWGEKTILVVDSLTSLGRAAFQWAKGMNPLSASGKQADARQWYKVAQDLIEDCIANLTSDEFQTNVIVISHIDIGESDAGIQKAFVSSIGRALGPKLPRAFNTLLLSETSGAGKAVRRRIKTMPTAMLELKNPAPMRIDAEYSIEDGMAKIFEALKK